ncbi:MAG: NADP-dependent malic enzyme [Actinomycetota bacterium]
MTDILPVRPLIERTWAEDARQRGPAFEAHLGGKIETMSMRAVSGAADLALAYTPGVAAVCTAINLEPGLVDVYTGRGNTVAIVTDGTAVLGLGNIGPAAALPVMEGKSQLFRRFGGINAVPICLATTDVDAIVETVIRIAPGFGGIHLEDISAPRCFEIEARLIEALDVPVYHDDQHGTAVVTLAALRNASIVVDKELSTLRVAISGAGASGIAVARLLLDAGVTDITLGDTEGLIGPARSGLTQVKETIRATTNPSGLNGDFATALVGADVFIGVSGARITESEIANMANDAIVFALANPEPEIHPSVASRHAAVVATGRSDFPNQINNLLCFPGLFRGVLDARAGSVSSAMKLAAADALTALVPRPAANRIVPNAFDPGVADAVASAVAAAV